MRLAPFALILGCALAWAVPPVPPTVTAGPAPGPREVGLEERLGQTVPLDLVLRDEAGGPVTLRSLVDKPTVLTLNYFRCASICSPQLNGVAEVINRTQAVPGRDFQVLTVSFDERDTPALAARKRTNYLREITRPFPPGAWRFLTGDAASTQALADAVGFHFRKQGEDFNHPAALIVLSPTGRVTRYLYGIAYLPADLQLAAQEAAGERVRPTIAQWLRICYAYDPASRAWVFSVTRVVLVVTLLAAVGFVGVLIFRGRPPRAAKGGGQ